MRICQTCGKRVPQGTRCACQKGRHKEYDAERRDKSAAAFYHSREWVRLTKYIKSRAGGCDEYIRHINGELRPGSIVHHIFPRDTRPDLALEPSNLILVSPATHRMIHDRYAVGANERAAMQGRLLAATGRDDG